MIFNTLSREGSRLGKTTGEPSGERKLWKKALGGVLLGFLASCSALSHPETVIRDKGSLYRSSMMEASAYRPVVLTPVECTPRYFDIRGEVLSGRPDGRPSLKLRIRKSWASGVDLSRKGPVVLPLSARISKLQSGTWVEKKVRGFVEFRDLSTCRIRRAAFVASDDPSVLEPALWVINLSPPSRTFWTPRILLLNAYRTVVNETISITGPVLFATPHRLYHPVSRINGVLQRKDLLRGVTPPDRFGTIDSTLWLKGKDQEFRIKGEGTTGMFVLHSHHTVGAGIFLPYPEPFYFYPRRSYRIAVAGSLLVDGPFAFEGKVVFDPEGQTVAISGHINEAGSLVPDFQTEVPFIKGRHSRFGVPGEVDFSFSFNKRRIDLVMFPDPNRRTMWVGSLNQNLLGMADPD